MKSNVVGYSFALVMFFASVLTPVHAAILAQDDAGNYSSFGQPTPNPANGGTGFGNWVLRSTTTANDSFNGSFLGSATDNDNFTGPYGDNINTSGQSFGMYANSGNRIVAYRGFNSSLSLNDTFRWSMDNGGVDEAGASVGLSLRNQNFNANPGDQFSNERFRFSFMQGFANYRITDSGGDIDTGISWRRSGLDLEFELTSDNTYTLTVLDVDTGSNLGTFNRTLGGTSDATLDSFAIFNNYAGSGGDRNAYFNNFEIESFDANAAVPEPGTMMLSLFGVLFFRLLRRRFLA